MVCGSCGKIYVIEDKVVSFPTVINEKCRPVAGKTSSATLANFISALKKYKEKKWQDIFQELVSRNDYYVTDYTRADFKCLLPLSKDAAFLEIGSSLGQIVLNIAPSVKGAWAVDVVKEQCIISALIAEREGKNNIHIACAGADGFLPYTDNSFDIVVMNNVIEWAGSLAFPEKPVVIQKRICSEIRRVLKPEGVFYISTKNRYALQYLIGGIDEHLNMRFGNALPQPFINWYAKRKKINNTTFVHSIRSLRKLLKTAGLNVTNSYWAIPDVRKPKYYVPLSTKMVKYVRKSAKIRICLPRKYQFFIRLLPACVFKNFVYSFILIGKK